MRGVKRRKLGFSSDRRGAAAVEFAMVAPIFFALTFAIIEVGYFFFVETVVAEAGRQAARTVRTGQAQNGITPQAFYDEICRIVGILGSCDERLTVDVAAFDSFDALRTDLSTPANDIECRDSSNPAIQPAQFGANDYGDGRDIVRVRICYLIKPFNPALGLHLNIDAAGFRQIVQTAIFRNEPFPPPAP